MNKNIVENPFSLTFGKEPLSLIDRHMQTYEIIQSFKASNPDYQVCMLTGVRGSGKTVSLTTISNELKQDEQWLVVELNQERNLYDKIWSELSELDRNVLIAMSSINDTKVEDIRREINMTSSNFSIYRKRLLKKGIVQASQYGHLVFVLPRFKEFVLRNM